MSKTLFSVGSQVIWESSVMKKQMQLQNRHSLPVTRMKLPATGMYPRITKLIFDNWQEVWNCCGGNKSHAIRPTVGDYKQKSCLSRRDSVLLNRLHIGHTRLTHSFLLTGDDLPEHVPRNVFEMMTVEVRLPVGGTATVLDAGCDPEHSISRPRVVHGRPSTGARGRRSALARRSADPPIQSNIRLLKR